MKKKFVIASLSFLLAGAVAFVVGMSVLDWDFKRLDSNDWRRHTVELNRSENDGQPLSKLDVIDIECKDADITVSFGESASVEYEECDNIPMEVSLEEEDGKSVLKIRQSRGKRSFFSMFQFHTAVVNVTVPAVGDVEIETVNGSVKMADGEADSVEIDAVNATVTLSSLSVHSLVKVESTNGEVTLESVSVTSDGGALKAKTVNGELNVKKIRAVSAELRTTNGAVRGAHVSAWEIKCSTTNGNIVVETVDANDMHFSTVNGNISLVLTGPNTYYTVRCSSVNGRIDAKNRDGGEHSLNCSTVNGNISVKFLQSNPV